MEKSRHTGINRSDCVRGTPLDRSPLSVSALSVKSLGHGGTVTVKSLWQRMRKRRERQREKRVLKIHLIALEQECLSSFFAVRCTQIDLQVLIAKPFNQFIVHVEFGLANAVG